MTENTDYWSLGKVVCFTDQGNFAMTTGSLESVSLVYAPALTISATEPDNAVFLGVLEGTPYWFIDDAHCADIVQHPRNALHLEKNFSALEHKIIAKVCGYIHFHHSFVKDLTYPTFHGRARKNDQGLLVFPRLDPAIIFLITNPSQDKILVARNARGNENFLYSPPAGFVEVGETLEDAVVREVKEELGIDVTDIHYHSSQSWPAPQSLMLGFIAASPQDDAQLTFCDGEIVDAKWLTREQVRDIRNGTDTSLIIPEPITVAGRMISDWLQGK